MKRGTLVGTLSHSALIALFATTTANAATSAEDVVQQCYYKYAGDDQRSMMQISLKAPGTKPQISEYTRIWKSYGGKDGVVDKVLLFTDTPLKDKGLAFMRWGYTGASSKVTEQWIYLPELRKVRRITPRDPETKDWVIKDEDLRLRELHEDDHTLLGEKSADGKPYYRVEFKPKSDPVYSKRVFWFSKTSDPEECSLHKVDFYDKKGIKAKQQLIEWRREGKAWIWDKVEIKDANSDAYIHYDMKEVEINVGLDDNLFTHRSMKKGYSK